MEKPSFNLEKGKGNPLLKGPDLIESEKSKEIVSSMNFIFSFDNRKYILGHSEAGPSIRIECYDKLPQDLNENERNNFSFDLNKYSLQIGDLEKGKNENLEDDAIEKPRKFEAGNVHPEEIKMDDFTDLLKEKKVIFYTGAGISADVVNDMGSLLKTLDIDGSKESDGFLKLAASNPKRALEIWENFTHDALNNESTPAHKALAQLALSINCKIFTENVDHLHEKTGLLAIRPTGNYLKTEIKKEWLIEIDAIVTVGLRSDDRGFLNWYKANNPKGKIIAINLELPQYLGNDDFLLKGDVQQIIPEILQKIKS